MRHLGRSAFVLVVLVGALALPGAAIAAPANDEFVNATVIDPSNLPFSEQVDIGSASTEPAEPQVCSFMPQTVWYAITPSTSKLLRVTPAGSSFFDSVLNVYRQNGSGLGGLSHVGCGTFGNSVLFTAAAGVTYYIQGGRAFGGPGTLSLNVQEIPPPANDNFANASATGALPFTDTIDTTAATLEPGEPSCGFGYVGTAWYAFTPSISGSYSASTPSLGIASQVAAYTGNALGNLSLVGCNAFGNLLTFHAAAGQTVYLQVGNIFGDRGSVRLDLTVAPDPVVQMSVSPPDPNLFDNVTFCDSSFDPGGNAIESRVWDFGDGSGSTDVCAAHRYTTDKTYTVVLTITTVDGRTKSLSRELIVKTHDVAIAKVGVPQTGNVAQTKQINVGLTNNRYAENVQVRLLKSVAGGEWQQVGVLTQWVPVRGPNRTTNFVFSYTFAPEDAVLGKVTFQAIADIQGARDAFQNDNSFISLATKVNG